MNIGDIVTRLPAHRDRLVAAREACTLAEDWYPYDILGNLIHLDGLLTGDNRELDRLSAGKPVADIGGADGDLAFALEQECGWEIDLIDTAPTNMNGLAGARALAAQLGSRVTIHDIDLDAQFDLPRPRYGLVLLLGLLYHLQNPFYVLRALSTRSDHCLLSTRVARYAGPEQTPIGSLPVAYLVGPDETNDDPTNYWMFSPAGLERIVSRTGWTVVGELSAGETFDSDPVRPDHDERSFMLLRSATAKAS